MYKTRYRSCLRALRITGLDFHAIVAKRGGEMTDIITYAKDLRNRYGTLQVFYDLGILEPVAADTANRYMKK